uniref:Putative apolipophorin-III n=1 Tax=Triatoma infestans TaxID=30076 RepID=A0A170YUN3_TRIIF
MVKLIACSLLLVLLVQNGRADQQQPEFQDWLHNAKQYLDGVAKDLKEKVGLPPDPNGADVLRVLKEHNDKLAQNLKESVQKIEEQWNTNEAVKSTVENIKAAFNAQAQKLKENNAEVASNFEKIGETLQGTWNSLTQEMEKSYNEFNKDGGKREELENYFKSLYDKVKTGAQELETKLQELNKKDRR